MRNLEKLGVRLIYRPVDFALYQQRLQKFDFDITSINFPGTLNPGQEYADLFGSKAADTEDSGNLAGVKSAAVDRLISEMVGANTHPRFLAACRALERVVSHSHYLLPQWYSPVHRLAYNAWRLQAGRRCHRTFVARRGPSTPGGRVGVEGARQRRRPSP
jgi:microcin C transport system substrate-binding protein